MNGSGTPVSGTRLSMAAMLTIACQTTHVMIPVTSSRENVSGARRAIRNPRTARYAKAAITSAPVRNPSSSQMIAKIESFIGSGKKKCFWIELLNPRPNNPPDPIATSACWTWYPVPSVSLDGSMNVSNRLIRYGAIAISSASSPTTLPANSAM